jgi:hypothetical protein
VSGKCFVRHSFPFIEKHVAVVAAVLGGNVLEMKVNWAMKADMKVKFVFRMGK